MLAQTFLGAELPLDLSPVDRLLERMDTHLAELRGRGDRAQIFIFTYRFLTTQMRKNLLAGRFADPMYAMGLMYRFAELYFVAEEGHRRGDRVACPAPWRAFFRVADASRRTSDAELLLLGMNAHIVHDLPLAMWEQMERAGDFAPMGQEAPMSGRLGVRQFDHDMVNEVLEESIDPMQDTLAREYFGWLRVVDVAMLRVDEWLIHLLLRSARRDVWTHVVALGCARHAGEAAAVRRHLVTEAMENVARIDVVNALPSRRLRNLARRLRPDFAELAERA
jgi:hypothetical protein